MYSSKTSMYVKHCFHERSRSFAPPRDQQMPQEKIDMNKPRLIDMFGLSGNPANDAQLDDLLFRLESESSTAPGVVSGEPCFLATHYSDGYAGF